MPPIIDKPGDPGYTEGHHIPVNQVQAITQRDAENQRSEVAYWTFIVLMVLLSFLFPPAVALIRTGISWDLLLNIILTCIFWIPGVIHALILTFVGPMLGASRESYYLPQPRTEVVV